MRGDIPPFSQYAFMGWCSVKKSTGATLSFTASGTALGPIQPPIQWVSGALSLAVKRTGREADHSTPCSAEVKECVELYLYSPIRLHDVVFSLKKAEGQLYLYLITCYDGQPYNTIHYEVLPNYISKCKYSSSLLMNSK
jgi:hypothetical protein